MTTDHIPIGHADLSNRARSLFSHYSPAAAVPDEMIGRDGGVRDHWQTLVRLLGELGPVELEKRWATARRLIHENGVTYNVYGDPDGMDRPWVLDALPLVFSAPEWAGLSDGLIQRARVLDMALADIYGPQRLLKDAIIPPDVIFPNPGYLRPLVGARPADHRRLHMVATDIGRCPDGSFCVLADRTQAPSGTGYALENRIVVSRAIPEIFRDCHVSRLATFFRSVRNLLQTAAPHNRDNPRVVLLTPGPYNETYFEHAYLAQYLGYTLVEGADLTVRDNRVFMKMLGGLQPVDVIFRRQDDGYCDPLELMPDSTLGIPGLVQAVHAGNVAVVNALGSGLMESPALGAFLPRICRHLLGEELKLPSVTSYWCGHEESLRYVLDHLPQLLIKPAFNTPRQGPISMESLSAGQLDDWRQRIAADPAQFVAEEQISLSTAPVIIGNRVEARHIAFRAHLAAAGESYDVMPGGLARFSISAESMIVSMQRGGGSKDTWVLSGGPVDSFSLLSPPGLPMEISRAGGDLSSRVADNLFWLGRYIERAEAIVRLSRGIVGRLVDQNFESSTELPLLLEALSRQAQIDRADEHGKVGEAEMEEILFAPALAYGLQATLRSVYTTASLVRDRMSIDTWRIINRIDSDFSGGDLRDRRLSDRLASLDKLMISFAAFAGLAMESMSRGLAWRFLDIGRRIERSAAMVQLCRTSLCGSEPPPPNALEAVLEVADSAITYRRRYMTSLQVPLVADLLLADETNPRSLAFQLARLQEHVAQLPGNQHEARLTPVQQILLLRLTELRLMDFNTLPAVAAKESCLQSRLDSMLVDMFQVSDLLSRRYLTHAAPGRSIGASASTR